MESVAGLSANSMAGSGVDWSCGPWEATCSTRLVRQRGTHDCGVACLAMSTASSYESARATFIALGLDQGTTPYSSNFAQLRGAVGQHASEGRAYQAKMVRWRGWDAFSGVGILKVRNCAARNWHWVVAESHPELGILARDPDYPMVLLERPCLDVVHSSLGWLEPYGNWLSVTITESLRVGAGQRPAAIRTTN